jgi:hypothetical protein
MMEYLPILLIISSTAVSIAEVAYTKEINAGVWLWIATAYASVKIYHF